MQMRNLGDGQTIIYPQGTRVLPGVKAPYKVGAEVIYRDQNLPCVLVATNGIFWGRRSIFRYPGKAIIKFVEGDRTWVGSTRVYVLR